MTLQREPIKINDMDVYVNTSNNEMYIFKKDHWHYCGKNETKEHWVEDQFFAMNHYNKECNTGCLRIPNDTTTTTI